MLKLLHKIAAGEDRLRRSKILAPCLAGGKIRARVEGLICELEPTPRDFEGWGIFSAQSLKGARLEQEASLAQVDGYQRLLRSLRLILVQPLRGRSWLALPANRSEAAQRLRVQGPVVVHLVTQGRAFGQVVARYDGGNLWFDKIDRGADPALPGYMAKALRAFSAPHALEFPGITPEYRAAYAMVCTPVPQEAQTLQEAPRARVRCSEERLRRALAQAGGALRSFVDQGDFWTTHWSTSTGEDHTSAIMKTDLTVMSAGICLAGEDQKFDLQSLVGVVEQREEDW